MKNSDLQLNLDFSHAALVIAKTAPSGVHSVSAKAAAEKPRFCFDTSLTHAQNIARIEWRILLQVLGMQINEMNRDLAHGSSESIVWQERISETLSRVNEKGRLFHPGSLPSDLRVPSQDCSALNANGANWCELLTRQLEQLFDNVQTVGITKIELFV